MVAITVVSVCYNEEKNIARTVESVLSQTTIDYEYLICDGLSGDRTVEIAESYRDAFAERGISYRIYSEKDSGVYDAMNKGIMLATGQYIYFLNAGDWFCSEDVLVFFADAVRHDCSPAVYYADYYYTENHRASRIKCDDFLLKERMTIGHPSMIARTDLMCQLQFDVRYRIAADYNFVLGLKMQDLVFKHLDFAAAYFLSGGISSVATEGKINDELRQIHENYGLPHKDVIINRLSHKQRFVNKVTRFIPKKVWRFWTKRIKHAMWVEY